MVKWTPYLAFIVGGLFEPAAFGFHHGGDNRLRCLQLMGVQPCHDAAGLLRIELNYRTNDLQHPLLKLFCNAEVQPG